MPSIPILNPPDIRVFTPMSDDQEPVFHAPWEAQIFALVVCLRDKGVFTASEWAQTLGVALRRRPGFSDFSIRDDLAQEASPYLFWIIALERLLIEKEVASAGMLSILRALWEERARETPHGQPITLDVS